MKKLLLMAVAALTSLATWAIDKPTLKYSALETDVEYYLYNVETESFIIGANDWGTRASVTTESTGYKVKIVANGDTYQLCNSKSSDFSTRIDCDGSLNAWVDGQGRGGDGQWTFSKIDETNTYEIYNTVAGEGNKWGVVPGLSNTRVFFASANANATATTWAFISLSDYEAYNAELRKYMLASTEKGTDLSGCFDALSPAKAGNGGWNIPSGWTIETEDQNGAFHVNTWSGEGNSDGSNMTTPFFERWVGGGATLNPCLMSTTLEGLNPNTVYELSALFRILFENGGVEVNNVNLVIGNKSIDVCEKGIAMNKGKYGTFNVQGATDAEGNLVIGVQVLEGTTASWVTWKNMKLTYVGSLQAALASYVEEAEELTEVAMDAELNAQLVELVAQYKGQDITAEQFDEVSLEFENVLILARNSVKLYEEAYAIMAKADESINRDAMEEAEDDDAIEAADNWTLACMAYYEGTLENLDDLNAAYLEVLKYFPAAGADLTLFIVNPNFDGNVNGWTDTFTNGNHGYQGASYSNGDTKISKFMECWVGHWNGTLADGKLSQVLNNLPEGNYTLSADLISVWQGGDLTIEEQTGVYVFATCAAGTFRSEKCSTNNEKPEHTSFTFNTTAGNCEIGLMIENTNCNWVAFDNVKLVYNGPMTINIYQEALKEAVANAMANAESEGLFEQECDAELMEACGEAIYGAQEISETDDLTDEEYLQAGTDMEDALSALKTSIKEYAYSKSLRYAIQMGTNEVVYSESGADMAKDWSLDHVDANFHFNTWSEEGLTDGTGMGKNFNEYWTNGGSKLADGVITHTPLKHLPAGNYAVSMLVRLENEAGGEASGVKFNGVDLQTITTQFAKGVYGVITDIVTVGEDGVLNFGFTVENAEANWFVWKGLTIRFVDADDTAAHLAVKAGAQYGTFCAPFAVTLPEGIKAYTATINENGTTIDLTEVATVAANTPVIIEAVDAEAGINFIDNGAEATVYTGKAVAGTPKVGVLYGVYNNVNVSNGYVLQNHDGVVAFYKVVEPVAITANHCYLIPTTNDDDNNDGFDEEVKAFYFNTDATAINAINALTAGKAAIYDMNGRQIQKLQKGINIVNGVKVLVK